MEACCKVDLQGGWRCGDLLVSVSVQGGAEAMIKGRGAGTGRARSALATTTDLGTPAKSEVPRFTVTVHDQQLLRRDRLFPSRIIEKTRMNTSLHMRYCHYSKGSFVWALRELPSLQ